jgi:4-hydroxybenzoyl-CoA reductase subunit beta
VDGWRATYWKLRRRGAFDFPVLGVAAAVRLEGDVCRDARIVLGAVASTPREVPEAAACLAGERLTPEVIARAADAAARPSKPLDNTDLVYHYRKRMTRVYVTRALRELAGLPPAEPGAVWPAGMTARAIEEAPPA